MDQFPRRPLTSYRFLCLVDFIAVLNQDKVSST